VTLSGLAERADVPAGEVGLEDHVRDVLAALEAQDLRDVVLVGHSYSGIVAGQVADRAPDRIAHTVFVDANLPHNGLSLTDAWSAVGRKFVRDQIEENDGHWPAPEVGDLDGHDLTPAQAEWIAGRATGHPGRTLFEPAALRRPITALTATYIACTRPDRELAPEAEALRGEAGWAFVALDTGHWPMVSSPRELAALLHEVSA
jgi:pimeloyl-ACP methyl ester carboxylesterase